MLRTVPRQKGFGEFGHTPLCPRSQTQGRASIYKGVSARAESAARERGNQGPAGSYTSGFPKSLSPNSTRSYAGHRVPAFSLAGLYWCGGALSFGATSLSWFYSTAATPSSLLQTFGKNDLRVSLHNIPSSLRTCSTPFRHGRLTSYLPGMGTAG